MRPTRWGLAMASLVMAAASIPAIAQAQPSDEPDRIELPNGWLPEGITTDGESLYSGSRADGAILKIGIRSGTTERFDGAPGRIAVGVDFDRERDLLWVAGGAGKEVRAQDADTGEVLATYAFPSPTARFVNDLTVTESAVYATDSLNKELLVVPLAESGGLPDPGDADLLPLSGDLVMATGNNLNGIVSSGNRLVAVQGNAGLLFSIDPRSGVTRQIDLGGYAVTNGDGLEPGKGVLYVVQNRANKIAVLDLDRTLTSGQVVDVIEGDDFAAEVDVPSTVALVKDSLYAVNARFGVTSPETAAYWITRADAYDG